jgi:RNA polymerase sigma factor (sigma-70 family)
MPLPDPIIATKLFAGFKQPAALKPVEDVQLWNAFRAGDEQAFVFIYEDNFDRLYAYGLRIAGDICLVEDGIQEVFIDLKNNRSRIKETDSIKFYLFKCLKRKLHREASKWLHKREELEESHSFSFTLSHEQFLIDKQMNEEELHQLNHAIEKLSPRKKEMIYYFFYEGLDYAQIQELMGLENIRSARNLLYKALDFLRDSLVK